MENQHLYGQFNVIWGTIDAEIKVSVSVHQYAGFEMIDLDSKRLKEKLIQIYKPTYT